MSINQNLIKKLQTPLQQPGVRNASYAKRLSNVKIIENLDRSDLNYKNKENSILIHTSQQNETVWLQFPGKESVTHSTNGRARLASAVRPWDFRPKAYGVNPANITPDLSFGHIWGLFFEIHKELPTSSQRDYLQILAILLYRMAFMLDHKIITQFSTQIRPVILNDQGASSSSTAPIILSDLMKYSPDIEVINELAHIHNKWTGLSIEAFLHYLDLLCWNEDCKYYFRLKHIQKKPGWINATGRINTVLTHIRIIGNTLRVVPLPIILNDFANKRGVSAATNDEIRAICGEFIS